MASREVPVPVLLPPPYPFVPLFFPPPGGGRVDDDRAVPAIDDGAKQWTDDDDDDDDDANATMMAEEARCLAFIVVCIPFVFLSLHSGGLAAEGGAARWCVNRMGVLWGV